MRAVVVRLDARVDLVGFVDAVDGAGDGPEAFGGEDTVLV
jgi:hypothetical protein